MLQERAPAKVNLYLHVVGRRADGYHLLDSLAVFPGAADILHAEKAHGLSLRVEGPHGAGLAAEADNLVLRAARALAEAAGIQPDAALLLHKNLPVASGIGGGSADAAAALRLLSRLWDISLPPPTMLALATRLGADVPVCLASSPTRMRGIGDLLSDAPRLPPFGMVLLNPGVAVATQSVFRARESAFTPPANLPAAWHDAASMAQTLATLHNDLEPPALTLCPIIGEALAWLRTQPGCLLARMSGSGATCFALFADTAAAAATPARVPNGWWAWGG